MIEGPLSLTEWNRSRYDPASTAGHYESWFQRANHPERAAGVLDPLHDLQPERPAGRRVRRDLGHLLRRRARPLTVVKESLPLARLPLLAPRPRSAHRPAHARHLHLEGRARSKKHTIALAARLRGRCSRRCFLLPQRLYDAAFPTAKALVARPTRSSRRAHDRRRARTRSTAGSAARTTTGAAGTPMLRLGPGRRLRRRTRRLPGMRDRAVAPRPAAGCRR